MDTSMNLCFCHSMAESSGALADLDGLAASAAWAGAARKMGVDVMASDVSSPMARAAREVLQTAVSFLFDFLSN